MDPTPIPFCTLLAGAFEPLDNNVLHNIVNVLTTLWTVIPMEYVAAFMTTWAFWQPTSSPAL